MQVLFDASDYRRVAAIYARMPRDLQAIAFRRAAGRARSVVERDYARFASRVLKVPQKLVMARLRSRVDGSDVLLTIRSTNIPLTEMNPAQRSYGLYVRDRGRYEHAFLVPASARRASGMALIRRTVKRVPTMMLFGPNPANAVNRKPADYEGILAEIAAGEFAKTILQQAAYLLGRA